MATREKLLWKVLRGASDANIRFAELTSLLRDLGFEERVMYKYEIIIYWSDEDDAFVAEVPELPGCTAHGDDADSALANCHDAIALWIDAARELGRPVPEPKGRRLQFA